MVVQGFLLQLQDLQLVVVAVVQEQVVMWHKELTVAATVQIIIQMQALEMEQH